MLLRVLSGVCCKAKHKLTFPQIQTNPFLNSIISKSLTTSNILYNNKSLHSHTSKTLLFNSNQTTQSIPQSIVPSNNKITTRGYFAPYYIFKEWEDTRSYRNDKWYRSQRAKRRRHKKWLKKTRVKRLVRKTLLENRVKAMREKRVKDKEERRVKLKKDYEKKVAHELWQTQLKETADEGKRERLAKHEAYMSELKERRKERLKRKSLAENEC